MPTHTDAEAVSPEQLITLFVDTNDDHYFNRLYRKFAGIVFGKALKFLEVYHEAEELSQNIWVKVYFHLKDFQGHSKFSTWLFTIHRRESLNYIRSRKKLLTYESIEKIEQEADNEHIQALDKHIDVTEALKHVSKELRILLILKYVDGLTFKQMSEETGIGISALKMQFKRFRDSINNNDSTTPCQK